MAALSSSCTAPTKWVGRRARPATSSSRPTLMTALDAISAHPANAEAASATTTATSPPNAVSTTSPLLAATASVLNHTQGAGARRSTYWLSGGANAGRAWSTCPGWHASDCAARTRVSVMTSARVPPDVVDVQLVLLDDALGPPAYAHPGDAGADLVTRVDVTLAPGARASVPTGVAIALPEGYAAFVHPRSGLAARHGLTVVNAPGTVDSGYRGEIQVTLLNTDAAEPVTLRRGDRVAQLVVQRVEQARFVVTAALPASPRGEGGHGSTGGFGSKGDGR